MQCVQCGSRCFVLLVAIFTPVFCHINTRPSLYREQVDVREIKMLEKWVSAVVYIITNVNTKHFVIVWPRRACILPLFLSFILSSFIFLIFNVSLGPLTADGFANCHTSMLCTLISPELCEIRFSVCLSACLWHNCHISELLLLFWIFNLQGVCVCNS